MRDRVGIEVSLAAAEAVAHARAEVIAAYPITPQTHIVEHLAELVAEGRLEAEYVPVESEHSALSACLGAAASGVRTFTATASQGLALMHEILFSASSMRLPVVMAVANRALSAPINIWADHSDIMPQRDTGWVQLFAQNGQDVYDHIIQSFKLAEDHRVMLPVMINLDGFSLSHMIEPITMLEQAEVDAFLPRFEPLRTLDTAAPRTLGALGSPEVYTEVKVQQERALDRSAQVLEDIWSDFEQRFGRRYQAVEAHRLEDAEVGLVTMGAISETARTAVDDLRQEGIRAGVLNLRLWRPFPSADLIRHLESLPLVVALDRALSPGAPLGPMAMELRSLFYDQPKRPVIAGTVAGLGGRELNRPFFRELLRQALANPALHETTPVFDVRHA
jgi:pyruvate ferredoxin oxidoreductase alpha subunit